MTEAFTGVVVGVDGGPASLAATELAAATAERHNEPLCLLSALQTASAAGLAPYAIDIDEWRSASNGMLTDIATQVSERHPGLRIVTSVGIGNAASVLIEASRTARTVVVGCRGRGGFTELLLGSVSTQLCEHAHGPVIVVRPADPEKLPAPGLPVVVGVDGSEDSENAVAYAYAEADARKVPLVVQYVWWLPANYDGLTPAEVWQVDTTTLEEEASRIVAEAIAGWSEKYPDVAIEPRVTRGADAEAELIESSTHAGLIVVGSRGRGGFAGLLLGSVSQALVHHAECPVAIVRVNRTD